LNQAWFWKFQVWAVKQGKVFGKATGCTYEDNLFKGEPPSYATFWFSLNYRQKKANQDNPN
jgi:hypothetical protein